MQGQATISILDQQAIDKLIYRLIRKTRKKHNGCIEWVGGRDQYGYAQIKLPGIKKSIGVHRASFELFVGPIPTLMHVCHKCDNPSCVNPTHLFAGTQSDNMRDMSSKGRATKYRSVHGKSKITKDDARDIFYACKSGRTHESLARQYGLTRSHVSKIARGEKWKLS